MVRANCSKSNEARFPFDKRHYRVLEVLALPGEEEAPVSRPSSDVVCLLFCVFHVFQHLFRFHLLQRHLSLPGFLCVSFIPFYFLFTA